MRDCPNAEMRDLLPDLLNGTLDAGARAEVEAHVASCADCRAELDMLRAIRRAAPQPAVNVARIVSALPAPAQPGARRRGWARARAWQAAAAVLLITGGATAVTMVARTRGAAAPAVRVAASADSRAADSADPSHAQTLMIGEGYSELTDAQLQALLDDVKKLDPMPSADPDVTPQITPLSQNGGA